MPHTVYILWGESAYGTRPTCYSFDTEAELNAFLFGVDESNGWMDYTARRPTDDCPVTNANGEECVLKAGHDGECEWPKEEE